MECFGLNRRSRSRSRSKSPQPIDPMDNVVLYFSNTLCNRILLYLRSSMDLCLIFTDVDNIDLWQEHRFYEIRTDDPFYSPLREIPGHHTRQECIGAIKEHLVPSLESWIQENKTPEYDLYVGLVLSGTGEGMPHRLHLLAAPFPMEGVEDDFLNKLDSQDPRTISEWIHISSPGCHLPKPRTSIEFMINPPGRIRKPPDFTQSTSSQAAEPTTTVLQTLSTKVEQTLKPLLGLTGSPSQPSTASTSSGASGGASAALQYFSSKFDEKIKPLLSGSASEGSPPSGATGPPIGTQSPSRPELVESSPKRTKSSTGSATVPSKLKKRYGPP